jgi:hypothetical protein
VSKISKSLEIKGNEIRTLTFFSPKSSRSKRITQKKSMTLGVKTTETSSPIHKLSKKLQIVEILYKITNNNNNNSRGGSGFTTSVSDQEPTCLCHFCL